MFQKNFKTVLVIINKNLWKIIGNKAIIIKSYGDYKVSPISKPNLDINKMIFRQESNQK